MFAVSVWLVQESYLPEEFSVKMGPRNPIIFHVSKTIQNKEWKNTPIEEIRFCNDRSRLVHATLQVYSTNFVRSSCVTLEKYLTTKNFDRYDEQSSCCLEVNSFVQEDHESSAIEAGLI